MTIEIQSCNFCYQGILMNIGRKVALLGDDRVYFYLPEIERSSFFVDIQPFRWYSILAEGLHVCD
jgi:hypothetical protein